MLGVYLSVFSMEAWKALPQEERKEHTLRECRACQEKFPELSKAFPAPTRRGKKAAVVPSKNTHSIQLSQHDLSSPKALGGKVLRELNNISQQAFLKSGEEVLVESPKSNIVLKPTANEEE